MLWLLYLIRSFVCMDILNAPCSEAFSILGCSVIFKSPFYGVSMFDECGIIHSNRIM